MTIQLKPEQEKFIQAQVTNGKYNSSEEAVDKMFQVFERLQLEYDEWVKETRDKIEAGIESLEKGEGVDGKVVLSRLQDKLHESRKNRL